MSAGAEDIVLACAHLADRAGAIDFEIGHLRDDPDHPGWYAQVRYQGARITADEHTTPTAAALALAERLLSGATCRCRQPVTLSDATPGCRWRLVGRRWEPGCDAPPIAMPGGTRGDHAAMQAALNRAERRALKRSGGET